MRVLTILTLLLRVKERTKGWVKIKGKTVLRCCLCVFQFERAGFLNTVLFSGKILLVMFFSSCPLSRKCQVLYSFATSQRKNTKGWIQIKVKTSCQEFGGAVCALEFELASHSLSEKQNRNLNFSAVENNTLLNLGSFERLSKAFWTDTISNSLFLGGYE